MKIVIDLDTREVTIESTNLVLARDEAHERTFDRVASMLHDHLGSRDTDVGCVPNTNATEVATTAVAETAAAPALKPRLTGADVISALEELTEEKPQWGARSAAAITKKLEARGYDVAGDAVSSAITAAKDNEGIIGRVRRNGEIVYSTN